MGKDMRVGAGLVGRCGASVVWKGAVMSNFTEQAIIEAFNGLLEERPLDKITVADISERCGINRNTFYYHYHDVYDLMDSIFRDETDRILKQYGNASNWREAVRAATSFVTERRTMIYHVYNSMSRNNLERYLFNIATDIMEHIMATDENLARLSASEREDVVVLFSSTLVGLVLRWLNEGMKEDPDAFVDNLLRLMEKIEPDMFMEGLTKGK
jgi:AcrR family transcriptional regulator